MKLFLKLLAYLASIGLIVGLYFAPRFELPDAQQPQSALASVDPMPVSAYCPGPLAEVGGEQGTDLGEISRIGKATYNLWGTEAEVVEEGGLFARVDTTDQSTKVLSVNQTQAVNRARLTGLAATYCPMPAASGYFLSGDSGPGSESVLHLANPNDVDLIVELELSLEEGIETDRISLAANEHKMISLVGLSGADSKFVLRYQTSGLPVAAFMQHREVSGLSATGVALVAPTKPALAGAVAGLVVADNAVKPPMLRVFNPGLEDVELNLQAIAGGEFELIQIRIPAGVLIEQELNLSPGSNLLSFEASGEVLLAIRNDVISPKVDFAWLTPSHLFDRDLYLAAPGNSELLLGNPTLEPVNVVVTGTQSSSVTIPARSQIPVAIERGPIRVQGTGFLAAVAVLSKAGYAVIQPSEMRNLGESIEVTVR